MCDPASLHWALRGDLRNPIPAVYIAVHLLPAPEDYELSADRAVDGYWIKFGTHGGTYVVKLDRCGGLTEWSAFDVTRRMAGRWWISTQAEPRTLYIWLRNWRLEVGVSPREDPTWVPFFKDSQETEAGASRRVTPFQVAHALP